MGLPFKYNLRNLKRRKMRTVLTIVGIGLVVLISIFMLSLSRGMLQTLKSTGSADNVIVLSRKGQTLILSSFEAADYNMLKHIPEVKKNVQGQPLISPEVYHPCSMDVDPGKYQSRPGVVRGVDPIAFEVNDKVAITQGLPPGKGFRVIVGKLVYAKLDVPQEALAVGKTICFEGQEWTIVGTFSAQDTALESEIWADIGDFMTLLNRQTYTSVTIKLNNIVDIDRVIADLNSRNDIKVKAMTEQAYYDDFAKGFKRIAYLTIIMSLIAFVGGLMTGMNTMYTSILGRIREIGTLKVLGFSRGSVILSFIMESLLMAFIGAVIGSLIGLSLNGIPAKLGMFAFTFRVDFVVLGAGLAIAVVIGVLGALIPSVKATGFSIPTALRYE